MRVCGDCSVVYSNLMPYCSPKALAKMSPTPGSPGGRATLTAPSFLAAASRASQVPAAAADAAGFEAVAAVDPAVLAAGAAGVEAGTAADPPQPARRNAAPVIQTHTARCRLLIDR